MLRLVQCIGAVIDVEFGRENMPKVYDALKVSDIDLTLEVQQQLGDGVVRTIALGSTDGLRRGLTVTGTGSVVLRYVDSAKLPKGVRGRAIVFVPKPEGDGLKWDCTRGDRPARLRPRKCRDVE